MQTTCDGGQITKTLPAFSPSSLSFRWYLKGLRGSWMAAPSLLWLLSLSPSTMSRCRDPVATQTHVSRRTSVACRRARPTVWKAMCVCVWGGGWGQLILMGWGWFQWDERKRAVPFRSHMLVGLWLLVKKKASGWLIWVSGHPSASIASPWDLNRTHLPPRCTHPSFAALAPLLSFKSICPCQRWKCKVGGTWRGSWH